MSTLQAIALGAMVAWTPSLVLLAFLLWRAPLNRRSVSKSRADNRGVVGRREPVRFTRMLRRVIGHS
jgi:hypothetical protein